MKKIKFIMVILICVLFIGGIGCINKFSKNENKEYLYPITLNGLNGLINNVGDVVLEPKYEFFKTYEYEKDSLIATKINDKWGYINTSGEIVIEPKYMLADNFFEGLACVRDTNGKVGFINNKGDYIIEPKFDMFEKSDSGFYYTYYFENGYAAVNYNNKTRFIDMKGDFISDIEFDDAYSFSDGLAAVKIDDKWGYIDETGKMIINAKYESADKFYNGLARVTQNDKTSFINKKGEMQFDEKFGKLLFDDFENGTFYAGDKIIDTKGRIIIQSNNEYNICGDISEGLIKIRSNENEKYGFCDEKGNIVIEPTFDSVSDFKNSMARVKGSVSEGIGKSSIKYGFIDKYGEVITGYSYEYTKEFNEDGVAMVRIKDSNDLLGLSEELVGYIDLDGNYIWEPTK